MTVEGGPTDDHDPQRLFHQRLAARSRSAVGVRHYARDRHDHDHRHATGNTVELERATATDGRPLRPGRAKVRLRAHGTEVGCRVVPLEGAGRVRLRITFTRLPDLRTSNTVVRTRSFTWMGCG